MERSGGSGCGRTSIEQCIGVRVNGSRVIRYVILPLAARVAIAPLTNSFITLVEDTSLAGTIQVPELFRQAQLITARTYETISRRR